MRQRIDLLVQRANWSPRLEGKFIASHDKQHASVLDNKTARHRHSIDPLSVSVHHLQGRNVVLPENSETLV